MMIYYWLAAPPEVPHDRQSHISPARSARPRRARRRSHARSGPRNRPRAWRGRRNSLLHGPQHADYYANRPETIEETAELVTARGGKGIAVVVDHLEPERVEKLISRIRKEQGKLHVLVNDISESAEHEFGKTFW